MSLSVIDVERIVQWSNPDGLHRVTSEHVVVVTELFAGFLSGVQTYEKPNELWAMLKTNKDPSTLERIQYVFHNLFCRFSPNESEKVRVLYALLYGETKRALDSTTDYLRAVVNNMNWSGARQEERDVRVV